MTHTFLKERSTSPERNQRVLFMRYELMQFKRLMTGRATLSNIEKSLVAGLGVYALILSSSLLLQGSR